MATVRLPQACYTVPGRAILVINCESDGGITCIAWFDCTVLNGSTENALDPGTIIPSVEALIDRIDDAVESIPADYSQLLASISSNFSTGTSYAAGAYVWYPGLTDNPGALYRFTSAHSGTWTGTDAVVVSIGNELNDTVRYTQQVHTDAEKAIARTNMGAAAAADLTALSNSVGTVPSGTTVENQIFSQGTQISTNASNIDALQRQVGTVPTGETVEGQITDLKSAINIGNLFYKQLTKEADWEQGGRAVNTGNSTTNSARIKTDYFSLNSIYKIKCETGYLISAYGKNSGGTYLGAWFPGTSQFAKSGTAIWTNEILVKDLTDNSASTISLVMKAEAGTDILPAVGVNCYFETISIDQIKSIIEPVPFLDKSCEAVAYFTSNTQPTFTHGENGSITVKGSRSNFRIYTNKGLLKTFTKLDSYELTNVQKLVYDVDADEIKAVSMTSSGNYILLFSNAGGNYNGILYPYYLKQLDEASNARIDTLSSNSEGEFAIKNVADGSDFKAVFFSDIHGASGNMDSILSFANDHSSVVDAILNGGDTVIRWLNDTSYNLDWYIAAITASSIDILSAVGNHDCWDGAYYTKASATDVYNAIIAPMVAKYTGIVQPTGASSSGLCYYYKDYGTSTRVIVLNCMAATSCNYWDTAQATWFENVLADAKTNNKHVICINHAPYHPDIAVRDASAKNWSTWYPYESDGVTIIADALDIVKDFIDGGGKFVCWLSGHLHEDNLLTATGYAGQMMVNIVTADAGRRSKVGVNTSGGSPYYDGFNYIGLDVANGLLKVYRKGWDMDAGMKKHDYLCYDYVNREIIAN